MSEGSPTLFEAVRKRLCDAEVALMIVEPRPRYAQIALDAIRDAEAELTAAEASLHD